MTLLALLALSTSAFAADWAAYESDSFTIYSNASERETLRMLENFEEFRRVTFFMLGLPDEPESERLKIFVFDKPGDFRRINSNNRIIGFFFHSIFGPRMIVGPQDDEDTQGTLYHEYVHYLMNRHFAVNYPLWYFEGIAEMLQTTAIESNAIVVGRAPPYGLWSPAPLSDVVANKLVNAEFSFYQTSWLMVHHFLIESYDDPIRAQQTAEYIRRYDAGEDPVDAFLDSYDTTMQKMRDELNLRRVDYRFAALTLPRMEYEGDVRKRGLEAGEDLYLLGDLAVELDEFASAHEYFDEFEELGIDSPLAMKVRSRRLITLGHEDRMQEGDALAAELLALDPDDADVLADLAHYAFDRYAYAVNHREARTRESLNRSIELGTRALEQNPGDLEALYYLGLAYEQRGEIQRAADALLESYDINPSVPRLNTALARVLVKGRQIELASYLLSRVYSATHSEETRTRIRAIQDAIESDDFDIASIDSML